MREENIIRTQQTEEEKKDAQGIGLEFRADCPSAEMKRKEGESCHSTLVNRPQGHVLLATRALLSLPKVWKMTVTAGTRHIFDNWS